MSVTCASAWSASFIKWPARFFIICGLILFFSQGAWANVVSAINGETSDLRTRILFDTQKVAKYSSALSRDGHKFYLYIHDIDNPKLKFGKTELKASSVVSGVRRGVRGTSDIVYIFTLKKAVKPQVFNVRVNGSENRLVVEFPHEAVSANNAQAKSSVQTEKTTGEKSSSTKQASANVQSKESESLGEVKKITNTKELEEALFSDLNGTGDGVSTARPDASLQVVAPVPKANKAVAKVEKPYIVVVDPGHGGKDPGAVGVNRIYEKNVTLSIGTMLVSYINADPKMRGYLTRSNDRFIELGERSEIARRHKANILISIHADSAANAKAMGASILVLSNKRATRENSKLEKNKDKHKNLLGGAGEIISNDTSDNPYFAAMILDLTSDNARTEGFNLATDILASLKKTVPLHHSTPIHRSLAVLKAPDIPSLLIETGYLSNREEAKLLATLNYRRAVAYSIYLGIKNYVSKNPIIIHDSANAHEQKSNSKASTKKNSNIKGTGTLKTTTYTVVKGDTLTKIAQKFGVSMSTLKKMNHLKSNSVMLGQKLQVPEK